MIITNFIEGKTKLQLLLIYTARIVSSRSWQIFLDLIQEILIRWVTQFDWGT